MRAPKMCSKICGIPPLLSITALHILHMPPSTCLSKYCHTLLLGVAFCGDDNFCVKLREMSQIAGITPNVRELIVCLVTSIRVTPGILNIDQYDSS